MKTITVTQAFTLQLASGTKVPFAAGTQEVEDAIAAHWYVQAHSTPATAQKQAQGDAEAERLAAEKAAAEKAEAERLAAKEAAATSGKKAK